MHYMAGMHYMALHRPYSDFEWICQLDESKGLDIGRSYRSDKKAAEFVHFIAEEQRNGFKELFQKCNFFSLICDGATDSSHQEAEVAYIQLCSSGIVKTFFLGIKNIGKPNAENITKAMIDLLDKFCTSWTNLLGLGQMELV